MRSKTTRFYLAVILLSAFLWQVPLNAQQTNRELTREKANTNTSKRVALVIGNGDYAKAKVLPNPANDAADMAKSLKSVGFEVFSGVNQTKRQMETLIRDFGAKLASSGGVGLFYYAGHGIQVGGENYLVPVDADIPEEDEVSYSAVPVSLVLTKMTTAKNDLNIVILDACRNNPFARSWRTFRDNSNADGLAKISPPTGTLVLYATEPGKVASDGAGRNGLFTEALLKQINKPNLEYDQLVKAVSADVWQKSNKQQLPWKEGNSLQDFYFVPKDSPVVEAVKNNQTETAITAKTKTEQEREAWDLVKNSTDAEDFRYFLKEFPDGANAANAKIRLEETVWLAVKNSSDKTKIQVYLNEFPTGANASAARIRLKQLETASTPTNATSGNTTANRTAGEVTKTTLPGGVEMSFAYIPAGSFERVKTERNSMTGFKEESVHTVKISQGFWMQTTEVTQAQWKAVMGVFPSKCDSGELKGKFLGDNKPIICVSWDNAQEFIRQMNLKNDGYKYRLPTEAEWEYAARAGTTGDYAGDLDSMAWYYNNSGDQILSGEWNEDKMHSNNNRMHEVATKQANAWGLYDMHGNVWEWCQDWLGDYPSGTLTDPTGPTSGKYRVQRGGGWSLTADRLRSAVRFSSKPSQRHAYVGFRVVKQ